MTDRVGQQLGNYRLLRLLGTGGFAEVYLGEQVHLGTHAAIKVLTARLPAEELAHFREEARTIARLNHPHIVRLLDFGLAGDTPYLVMEYAANGTLRQRHPRGKPLPPGVVLPYVQQIASALQYAHERKLIHRDIKPENMLIGESGGILLSDFGIALVAQSSRYQSTQDTAGTLAYMAPEQIQGHPRPASDQYALGVVVYEWIAGERPFTGSLGEIIAQHLSQPPRSLREKVQGISAALDVVVLTTLAKDPKERFQTMQAFANALEQASQATFVLERGSSSSPSLLPPTPQPPTLPAPPPVTMLGTGEPAAGAPTLAATGRGGAAPGTRPAGVTVQGTAPGPERAPVSVMVPIKKKASRQKKALIVALVIVLLAATGGLIGTLVWNNGPKFNAAYQSIVSRKPDVEYTMRDSFSQSYWVNQAGCTFAAQGYLVTSDATTCRGRNGLSDGRIANLLVQATMSIQSGMCGALAVSDPGFEADLCADGTTNRCTIDHDSQSCNAISTDAIHQGLGKENALALEVVAGQNNQFQLIIFINGQYVEEETADQSQLVSASIFLSPRLSSSTASSILYTDVQVWKVSNPVS